MKFSALHLHLLEIVRFGVAVISALALTAPASAITFNYGQHFPNGISAVDYIYGPEGMWKNMTSLKYKWNYYEQWSTPSHPYGKENLIEAANGSYFFTARDANGYLLCDNDRDLELDPGYCGFAFHEHSAKGIGGQSRGRPFTQFWLDDNWLARQMSQAYFRPTPDGLKEQDAFMRWRIMSGDPTHWILYNSTHFDTFALDGLYFLAVGDVNSALVKWYASLELSKAVFDQAVDQEFKYPGVHENYHMGLWTVLTEFILKEGPEIISKETYTEILQHSVSLRSNILKNQEKDESGRYIGWISNIGGENSLINSESISCGVLGLGANSRYVFEASMSPMKIGSGNNFTVGNYIVSAMVGISTPGILSFGPNVQLQPGIYEVIFVLRVVRSKQIEGIAKIDIYDSTANNVLAEKVLSMSDFIGEIIWSRIGLIVTVSQEELGHLFEFRTHWMGNANLDIAVVRVQDL